jgi:hypothetical protein
MPAAEEKVVLQLSLDLKDAKKEMKDFRKDVKGIQKETISASKDTDKAWRDQKKTLDELAKTVRMLAQVTVESERKRQQEAKKTTDTFKKQEESLKKQEDTIKKIGKEMRGQTRAGAAGAAGAATPEQRRRVGFGRRAVGAGVGLVSGIGGFFMGGLQSGFGQYMGYGQAQFGLAGMGTPQGLQRGLRGARGIGGAGLGYGPTETVQQAAQVGRQTGSIGAVYRAQQLALAGGGMGVGEAAGIMGGFREAGMRFGLGREARTKADRREDIRIQREASKTMGSLIEGGMISGLDKAKLPEYLQSVSQVAEEVGGRQFGRVNLRGIGAGLSQLMGELGITPRRAMGVSRQFDQMIRAPGAGEAGNALVMQAFGFGKPGGQTSYYDALKRQQRGYFGEGGRQNLQDVFGEVYRQYGVKGGGGKGPEQQEANIVLSQLSGLTLDQVESLGEVLNSNKSQEEKMKKIKEAMEKAEPIEKQALNESKKGFAGIKKHVAGIEGAMIGLGAKFAPEMLKFQKAQIDALQSMAPLVRSGMNLLVKHLPDLVMAIKGMTDILRNIGAEFGLTKSTQEMGDVEMAKELKKRGEKHLAEAEKSKTFMGIRQNIQKASRLDDYFRNKQKGHSREAWEDISAVTMPADEKNRILDLVSKKARVRGMEGALSGDKKLKGYHLEQIRSILDVGKGRVELPEKEASNRADKILQILVKYLKPGSKPTAALTPTPVLQQYSMSRPGDPRRDSAGHDGNIIGVPPSATGGSSPGKTA